MDGFEGKFCMDSAHPLLSGRMKVIELEVQFGEREADESLLWSYGVTRRLIYMAA